MTKEIELARNKLAKKRYRNAQERFLLESLVYEVELLNQEPRRELADDRAGVSVEQRRKWITPRASMQHTNSYGE